MEDLKMIMDYESKCRPTRKEYLEMTIEDKRLLLIQLQKQDVLKWVKIASICFVISFITSVSIFVLYLITIIF